MKILINGWYGNNNLGDEAILEVFLDQMRRRGDVSVTVLSENPDNVLKNHPGRDIRTAPHFRFFSLYFLLGVFFRKPCRDYLAAIRNADIFVLGGGSLLRDDVPFRTVLRVLDEIWLARLFGVPCALYAMGAGPIRSRVTGWLIGWSVRRCRAITVRDSHSAELLASLGVERDKIDIVADPVFLYGRPETANPGQPPADRDPAGTPVGVILTEELVTGWRDLEPERVIAAVLDEQFEQYGKRYRFLPCRCHDGTDDREAARRVIAAMNHPEAAEMIKTPLLPGEFFEALRDLEFVVSARLHGSILAMAAGTPCIGINYHTKIRDVFADAGLADRVVDINAGLGPRLAALMSRMQDATLADKSPRFVVKDDIEDRAARTFDILWKAASPPS